MPALNLKKAIVAINDLDDWIENNPVESIQSVCYLDTGQVLIFYIPSSQ